MSLILCLEDCAGKDTNLEVKRDDDFASFLQRAKMKLGYAPNLLDITEGEKVSLDDNIYDFLIRSEKVKGDDETATESADGEQNGDEYGDVEYLTETDYLYDESSQEAERPEYLEEDSDEPDIVDVEVLDSSLEDDEDGESDRGVKKSKWNSLEEELGQFESALSDLLHSEVAEPVKQQSAELYTKEDLLDVLGNSPTRRGFDEGVSVLPGTGPTVLVERMSDEDIERCLTDPAWIACYLKKIEPNLKRLAGTSSSSAAFSFDESRYLPANYEDVDNEGVYDDYMDEDFTFTDVNDLLTIRKGVDVAPDKKGDARSDPASGKRPRGRPRKNQPVVKPPPRVDSDEESDDEDEINGFDSYLTAAVKSEPIDEEDVDYVPGQNIDWGKIKKNKERFDCRLCGNHFNKLSSAMSHAHFHRLPGNVFPCILCNYAFQSYVDLQKHMKREHKKITKRAAGKAGINVTPADPDKPKSRRGRKPKYLTQIKIEIIDDEEVCDVEMLEEWLDEDMLESESEDEYPPDDDDVEEFKSDVASADDSASVQNDTTKQVIGDRASDNLDEEGSSVDGQLVDEQSTYVQDVEGNSNDGPWELQEIKCANCLVEFSSYELLADHQCVGKKGKTRSAKGVIRCAFCGQTFPTRGGLLYHRLIHQAELISLGGACFKCPDKKFANETELFDHVNNEHNIDFECDHPGCTKKFHLRSALRAHTRTHGSKYHQCNVCGKQFYDVHNLKEHNITHLPVKPFQCHICHKFLNRKSRLRMHLLAHKSNPVENYVLACKHCKMAFKDENDAELHIIDSEDCCTNILNDIDRSEVISVLQNATSDINTVKTLESFGFSIESLLNDIKGEPTVDEIVNETLAKNGIVDIGSIKPENIASLHRSTSIMEGDMGMLLHDVDSMKSNDDNATISDTHLNKVNEDFGDFIGTDMSVELNSGQSNQTIIQDMNAVKELLDGVDDDDVIHPNAEEMKAISSESARENMMSIEESQDAGLKMEVDDFGGIVNASAVETDEALQSFDLKILSNEDAEKSDNKNKIVTEEELVSRLKETSKLFIRAVKVMIVYRCEYCEKVFYTKDALTSHRKCHEGLRNPFICNVCKAAFATFARCISHKTMHGFYKVNVDSDDNEKSSQEVTGYEAFPVIKHFLCQHCSKSFLHWTYLQVHKRHNHGNGVYYFNCKICGEKFTDSWALNSHKRKAHAEILNMKKRVNTSYKCADCGEGFNQRLFLAKHRLKHHKDPSLMLPKNKTGPYACTKCDKMYQTKAGLDGHMRTHNGGVYLCDLCGNGFALRAGLDSHHKRVHLKQIKYPCNDCGQSFFAATELETHKRCHTGEKPYPCEFCPMSFRTKGRRNEHHRTHTGERPYPCDICGLAFRRSNAMKNHRLTHTGERRHSCPHCPKLFHVHSNLKTHMKIKHPREYVLLEVKGKTESLGNPLKLFSGNEKSLLNVEIKDETLNNETTQMLVLEDVVIEDENEAILRQESAQNIMEYTYTTDDNSGHLQGEIITQEESVGGLKLERKIQIQLLDQTTDDGSRIYYAVGDGTGDNDLRLIDSEVRFTLVDDIGDDHKQAQFTIIDNDQFVLEES